MRVLFLSLILLFLSCAAFAQEFTEKPLPLDATLSEDGTGVTLTWRDAPRPRVGPVDVNRRIYGSTGPDTWERRIEGMEPKLFFNDTGLEPGVAYEYQVIRRARDIVDVGYWVTGVELPAVEQRGIALLAVDETLQDAIGPELARFSKDLVGDGWRVTQIGVPRHDAENPLANLDVARRLRSWVAAQVAENRDVEHSLILVGHVPIVRSGRAAPDGHKAVSHATDLFYADLGRRWPELSREVEPGVLRYNTLPDLQIDMTVGRIDFEPVARKKPTRELGLLRGYFDKNHHWRNGRLGDLRNAYGQNKNVLAETYALRNLVGPRAVRKGGHHDVGETQPWLFGVDFGDHKGANYAGYANKAVFAINFGSHKHKFDRAGNPMIALLAQPWYPLAVGWGARPTWWLHHMALGGTIGDVHRRTVNNGDVRQSDYRTALDYFPTGRYLFRNAVWINLMGDPTLRAFPLAPPTRLVATPSDNGVKLRWEASTDPDTLGYRVYRRAVGAAGFEALTPDALVTDTAFTAPGAGEDTLFMVKAYGLKQVYAGSFHTYSQGAMTALGYTPVGLAPDRFETRADAPLRLPTPNAPLILSFVEGPESGDLARDGETWVYTPAPETAGAVRLRAAVSGVLDTSYAEWVVDVVPALVEPALEQD